MVVVLALLAALANAVASICQRLGVEDAPHEKRPVAGTRTPHGPAAIWLVGFVHHGAGYACAGRRAAPRHVDVVQPLLVSELVMLVVILWLWYRDATAGSRPGGRGRDGGWAWAFSSSWRRPESGTRVPSDGRWFGAGVATLVVAVVLVALGSGGIRRGRRRVLLLGARRGRWALLCSPPSRSR